MTAPTIAPAGNRELPPDADTDGPANASSVWSAFVRGLASSSTLSLVVAFAVAATISFLGSQFITEKWVVDHGELLSRGDGDLELDITRSVLALQRDGPPAPAVALLGELGNESSYPADELRAVWSRPDATLPELVDLRLPAATLYESLILAGQLPRGWRAQPVIVLSVDELLVSPRNYVAIENRPRLGVRSHLAGFELRSIGLQPVPLRRNYFVDNQSFLLSRGRAAITNLLAPRSSGTQQWRDDAHQLSRYRTRPIANYHMVSAYVNLRILAHMMDHLTKVSGRPPVLLFLTAGQENDLAFQMVAPKIVEIAAERGAKIGWIKPGGQQRGGLPLEVWQALRDEALQLQESQP
ncbi:MAG: hypothetical protein AB7U73_10240 [Pirellulales bacterium]